MAVIRAAGGVLWDVRDGVVKVCLVHRPRYDDWSLPKGKLASGEHLLLAGLREVAEETGFSASVGRPLGDVQYLKDGTQKTVSYWAMRAGSGTFSANDEVDELLWLPPHHAQRLLSQDRDRDVITRFMAAPVDTSVFVLLRHASAGDRGSFAGNDRERPLDPTGLAQADALVPILSAYGIERALSADVVRCVDTVRPYAVAQALTVGSEPLLSESGYAANPEAALRRATALVADRQATVACSQGGVIGDLLRAMCATYGHKAPPDPTARKGTFWAMHFAGDDLLALEKQSALA